MKILNGQLRRLGESTHEDEGKNYSVIEIGDVHLTHVFVGLGMDSYLRSCEGRECTLYLNRSRYLFALTDKGRTYAIKVGVAAVIVRMVLAGFFGLLFVVGALANVVDYFTTRGGQSLNVLGAMIFGLLAFFTVRAFARSVSVLSDLGKVRSLPGAVFI